MIHSILYIILDKLYIIHCILYIIVCIRQNMSYIIYHNIMFFYAHVFFCGKISCTPSWWYFGLSKTLNKIMIKHAVPCPKMADT